MSIRILFVDDHQEIRQTIKRIYEFYQDDVDVELFEDALSALKRIKGGSPFDVILLDYQMYPGNQGGIWAAERIRALSPQTPIIFVSAYTGEENLRAAEQVGAVAYISKEVATREETAMGILERDWPALHRLAGAGDKGVWFFGENVAEQVSPQRMKITG